MPWEQLGYIVGLTIKKPSPWLEIMHDIKADIHLTLIPNDKFLIMPKYHDYHLPFAMTNRKFQFGWINDSQETVSEAHRCYISYAHVKDKALRVVDDKKIEVTTYDVKLQAENILMFHHNQWNLNLRTLYLWETPEVCPCDQTLRYLSEKGSCEIEVKLDNSITILL